MRVEEQERVGQGLALGSWSRPLSRSLGARWNRCAERVSRQKGVCAAAELAQMYCHFTLEATQGQISSPISRRCYLREVAFEWELTQETIHLPLACLQGGVHLSGPANESRKRAFSSHQRCTPARISRVHLYFWYQDAGSGVVQVQIRPNPLRI